MTKSHSSKTSQTTKMLIDALWETYTQARMFSEVKVQLETLKEIARLEGLV